MPANDDEPLDVGPLGPVAEALEASASSATPSEQSLQEVQLYEKEAKRRDAQRTQKVKDELFWCLRTALRTITVLVLAAVIVWAWHLVMPDRWRWLSAEDRDLLQTILLSGALSAAATAAAKKVLP